MELALTAPFPMPRIPMQLLVNNTIKQLAGGQLPESSNDWLKLAGSAGSYLANNLPDVLVRALPNITVGTQTISLGLETVKVLRALTSGNGTLELPLPGVLAGGVGIAAPSIKVNLADAGKQIQSIPTTVARVADQVRTVVKQLPEGLPGLDAFVTADGTFDFAGLIKSTLNVQGEEVDLEAPAASADKVILSLTKALPAVAKSLGLNTTAIRFPDVSVVKAVLLAANGARMFTTDSAGRVDLVATLSQLPAKLPQLKSISTVLPAPPAGWPKADELISLVSKVATVADKLRP